MMARRSRDSLYILHELRERERGEDHLHTIQIKTSNKFDQCAAPLTLLLLLLVPQRHKFLSSSTALRLLLRQQNLKHQQDQASVYSLHLINTIENTPISIVPYESLHSISPDSFKDPNTNRSCVMFLYQITRTVRGCTVY